MIIPSEIKTLISKQIKEEISNYKSEIEGLKNDIKDLKIEIAILKEGGNL